MRVIPSQIAFEETWEKALRDKEERGVIDVAAVLDFFVENPTIELVPPVDPFYPLRTEVMEKLRKRLEQICREA